MRIAVIGFGAAGSKIHVPALRGLGGVEIVGAHDIDPARRRAAKSDFGLTVFDGFDTLVEATSPDVVIVATPPESHAEYCIRSLEAGAHVICEKPFVTSVDEATSVIDAAARAARGVALNHEFPQMPIFRAVIDSIGQPDTGEPVVAQAWQVVHLPPGTEPGWRGTIPNRTLYEAGVHLVDLLLEVFRAKPRSVTATMTREPGSGAEAVVFLSLDFGEGRIAHVTQNRLSRGDNLYLELRADGTEASLRASFGGRGRVSAGLLRTKRPHVRFEWGASGLAWKERGSHRSIIARNPRNPEMRATRRLFERTFAAFAEGRPPPVSAERGRDVLEIVAAAYRSADTGRRIDLDTETSAIRSLMLGRE